MLVLWAVGLLVLAPFMASVHVAEYDEAIFLDVARNIQRMGLPLRSIGANGVFFFDHTPLYPYMLSLYAQHTDTGLFLARAVTVLAALAAIALTYRFGARFDGPRPGLLAALLLAINPFFATYAFFVRMEIFMLLALLVGFYALLVGLEEKRNALLLASGISLAVAVLFKEFALVGTVVATAFAFWQWRRTPKQGMIAALIVGMPSLLALAGWAVWSWELSPATFAATMNRWGNSATSSIGGEPRIGLTWIAWLAQVGSRLLGPGLALGLLIALGQWVVRRGRTEPYLGLLWAYTLGAIGLSFLTSLKEPRHLIAVLPAAALLTGHTLRDIWAEHIVGAQPVQAAPALRASPVKPVVAAIVIGIVFMLASPLRPPLLPRPVGDSMPWVAPVYAERIANDSFYCVLAMAGKQVKATTVPGEVVTVAHQAPVVAYYSDRPYTMLYTLPAAAINKLLSESTVLVWDAPTFLALRSDERERVEAAVAANFVLEKVVTDDQRSVAIYKRK